MDDFAEAARVLIAKEDYKLRGGILLSNPIPKEYALDEEESARIDVDDGNTLIVLDTPYLSDKEKGLYSSAPFIIAYNYEYYVTIERHNFELIDELFKRVKLIEPHKHVRLT